MAKSGNGSDSGNISELIQPVRFPGDFTPLRGLGHGPQPDRVAGVIQHTTATTASLKIKYFRVDDIIPENLPPREWMLGSTFARGFLSGLVGAGGAGKSAIRLLQYISVVTGRQLTGEKVHMRGRVQIICLEDSLAETRRRIAAAMIHHRIDPSELTDLVICVPDAQAKLMTADRWGNRSPGPLLEALEKPMDIIALDPFVKAHSLGENDNGAIDDLVSMLVAQARDWDFAPDIVHHTRKGLAKAGDADSSRGGSALVDAGRLIRTATGMSEIDAETFGISEAERPRYIRVDDAKVNLSAKNTKPMWFQLVSVALGNISVNPLYPYGDHVQTVERWYPPNPWAEISTAVANSILDELERAEVRYSHHKQSSTRQAWLVVQRHAPGLSETNCREVIATWLRNGVLFYGECPDAHRKTVQGLFVNATKRPT